MTLKTDRNCFIKELNAHLPRICRTNCDPKFSLYEGIINEVGDVLESLSIVFTDPEEKTGSYGSQKKYISKESLQTAYRHCPPETLYVQISVFQEMLKTLYFINDCQR